MLIDRGGRGGLLSYLGTFMSKFVCCSKKNSSRGKKSTYSRKKV